MTDDAPPNRPRKTTAARPTKKAASSGRARPAKKAASPGSPPPNPRPNLSPFAEAARRLAEEQAAAGSQSRAPSPPPRADTPAEPASQAGPEPAAPAPSPPVERTAAEGADHYPPPPDYSQYPPPASPGAAGPPYAPGVPGVEPRYSPWWKRVLAALLDGLIISVPSGILGGLLGASAFETDPITDELIFDVNGAYIVALVITFIGSLLYYVILEGGPGGATVGKMALGIQVRDERTLSPIGYGRALGRRLVASLLWYLLILPGLLDVLAPLWDGKRRTWHDRIVGSVVIDKR